jgi:hypothetical protein
MNILSPLALVLACTALASCAGTRKLADPVLEIRSSEGRELGVATDYGLIFLGRTARSGAIDVTAWYGDGPSVEATVVEPLGGGLYTAETEIRLPRVPMSFDTPKPGTLLLVIGRNGATRWEAAVAVEKSDKIDGLLLTAAPAILEQPSAIGAGVYLVGEDRSEKRLVALVSGRVTLQRADGKSEDFITAVGPDQLWRLLTYRRDYPHKRRFVYREDVL